MAKDYSKKFYRSKAWQECRKGYIDSVNGLCERCLIKRIYKPGKIVHHINYITPTNINDPYITLNWDNLEYLCQDCHNEEHHAKEIIANGLFFDENGQICPHEKLKF